MIDADYTGEVKIIMVNYNEQDYEVKKGDKIAQLIVEKIMDEEIVLVKELDSTEREAKGFGSSDTEMSKQVGTGANLLTKHSWEVPGRSDQPNSHNQSLSEKVLSEHSKNQPDRGCRETPSQPMMTKQVRTGANLLTNPFQKVTRPTDYKEGHNPHKQKIHISEITQKEFRQAYRNGEATGIVKF